MEDLPNYIFIIFISIGAIFFVFDIAFLVNWWRLRKYVRPYVKYGIVVALISMAISLVDSYWTSKIMESFEKFSDDSIMSNVGGLIFNFFVLIAATVVGLHYAHILNNPQLPILNPNLKASSYLDDLPLRSQVKRKRVSISRIDWMFAVLTIAVASAIVEGLFLGFNIDFNYFSQDEEFRSMMQSLESAELNWAVGLVGSLLAIFNVEITFRLGVQNLLSVWWGESELAQWIAIIVASVLSALPIFMVSSSAWAFFFQIFITGLGLGWLNKRYGILASIVASLISVLIMFSIGVDTPYTY